MCNAECVVFVALNLAQSEIENKDVIEIGSMDINGSVRALVERLKPKSYVGVDVTKGPCVDVTCNAEDLVHAFKLESFDVLISTEMVEHVRNWKKVIGNFKKVVKPGGIILLTTRSIGFPYHAYPNDFWRFELEDIQKIFSDCKIEKLQRDPERGVLAKISKPVHFAEKDLSDYELFSIIVKKRIRSLDDRDLKNFMRRLEVTRKISVVKQKAQKAIGLDNP
jgi:SAM-dependent methyltransferase